MTNDYSMDLANEQSFSSLLQSVTELYSSASDIGIARLDKKSCLYQEERDKSMIDIDKEETLKIIKQTTDIARRAMILLVHGVQLYAFYKSRKSMCFSTFSSAISFIREEKDPCQTPKHLLLEWERILTLIDLFTSDEGLYCNKRIAQDMFDICMETFDWLRSISNNNK